MLHDMKIIGVLKAMAEANIDFWGTGSRFSSGRTTGDFDFFTKDCPSVVDFLERQGFFVNGEGYNDLLVCAVMEHPTGIHVQLTMDVWLRREVRDFIAASDLEQSIPKVERRCIWNMVTKGLKAQRDSAKPQADRSPDILGYPHLD